MNLRIVASAAFLGAPASAGITSLLHHFFCDHCDELVSRVDFSPSFPLDPTGLSDVLLAV